MRKERDAKFWENVEKYEKLVQLRRELHAEIDEVKSKLFKGLGDGARFDRNKRVQIVGSQSTTFSITKLREKFGDEFDPSKIGDKAAGMFMYEGGDIAAGSEGTCYCGAVKVKCEDPPVKNAFAIVYQDLGPVRVAGDLIFNRLKSIASEAGNRVADLEALQAADDRQKEGKGGRIVGSLWEAPPPANERAKLGGSDQPTTTYGTTALETSLLMGAAASTNSL